MGKKTRKNEEAPPAKPHGSAALTSTIAAMCWCWAFAQLATRQVHILDYFVMHPAEPAWGFIGLPVLDLVFVAAFGVLLGRGCFLVSQNQKSPFTAPAIWLISSVVIGVLDVARLVNFDLPYTMAEPLFFIFVTGGAVGSIVGNSSFLEHRKLKFPMPGVVAGGMLIAMVCWYLQAERAYDNFRLGYHDAGHFARRVINTWEGRGFLLETPSLPPFWDHFNPGLVLLAPLWGMWPDPKVFLALQSVCLATPALLVFLIAKSHSNSDTTATAWGIAYLLFPAVGQLNLNYGYGWHPVSVSMPLIFGAILSVLHGKHWFAAILILLACSFNEVVIVVVGCVAAMMAISQFAQGFLRLNVRTGEHHFGSQYRWPIWMSIWATCTVGFILVWKFAGFSNFQGGRIASNLSFWNAMKPDSIWFVAALLAPLGTIGIFRGWPFLLSLILPIGVLLTWSYEHSTSLAFQYTSALIPILFLAAIAGTSRPGSSSNDSDQARVFGPAMGALAACLIGSTLFGQFFTSRPTLEVLELKTYRGENSQINEQRRPRSDGIKALTDAVEMANDPDAAVLATGNVALHLIGVHRLESVDEAAVSRREALAREAGDGRSWIEVFDWLVLDTREDFQQSTVLTHSVIRDASKLGYQVIGNRHGVVVMRRPDS